MNAMPWVVPSTRPHPALTTLELFVKLSDTYHELCLLVLEHFDIPDKWRQTTVEMRFLRRPIRNSLFCIMVVLRHPPLPEYTEGIVSLATTTVLGAITLLLVSKVPSAGLTVYRDLGLLYMATITSSACSLADVVTQSRRGCGKGAHYVCCSNRKMLRFLWDTNGTMEMAAPVHRTYYRR